LWHFGGRLAQLGVGFLALTLIASSAFAQKSTISGVVKDANTGVPVPSVTVRIPNTPYAFPTGDDGKYTLKDVPYGIYNIEATRIGYSTGNVTDLHVDQPTMTADISMGATALSLTAMTTSASSDPITGVKAPFATTTITSEDMPVPMMQNFGSLIQGKVAGVIVTRQSGAPGATALFQIDAVSSSFTNPQPLFVIDGVPLDQNLIPDQAANSAVTPNSLSLQDLDGMDIESIEVIKGAAAAAMYGSRASGGVISITTKRGADVGLGKSQLQMRGLYGDEFADHIPGPAQHNDFLENAADQWVGTNGSVVPRISRVVDPSGMLDHDYAVTYNPLTQIFVNDHPYNSDVSLSQASATSNFHIAFSRSQDPGTVRNIQGKTQSSASFGVQHQLRDNVSEDLSLTHSAAYTIPTDANFTSVFEGYDPDVNLLRTDPVVAGAYVIIPDSAAQTTVNPLYLQQVEPQITYQNRTRISSSTEFRPTNWLKLTGLVGYDRGDQNGSTWEPPGLNLTDNGSLSTGTLTYTNGNQSGIEATLTASLQHDFGNLTTRLAIKGDDQHENDVAFTGHGVSFPTGTGQTLGNATTQTTTSSLTNTALEGGSADLACDYSGRYTCDLAWRREGNSLYGPENRWGSFGRVAGAWIMSQESWWPSMLKDVTLFKIRENFGSSGNQPSFGEATTNLGTANGGQQFLYSNLGDPNLAAEITHDNELGFDAIINNRISIQFTYDTKRTSNQIVGANAPDISGFNIFYVNQGSSEGRTFEAQIQGDLIHNLLIAGKPFVWNGNITLSQSHSETLYLGRVPLLDGAILTQNYTSLEEFWGQETYKNISQLPVGRNITTAAWAVDANGFLVPVGVGNTPNQGISKGLWGTTVTIDGVSYAWGRPQLVYNDSQQAACSCELSSSTNPKLDYGFGSRMTYGNWTLYLGIVGRIGGQMYDQVVQTEMTAGTLPNEDQTGVVDSLKKPIQYYESGWADGNADDQGDFLEGDGFIKLNEATLQYSIDSRKHPIIQKMGADRLVIGFVGNNLYTYTRYKGEDPEAYANTSNYDLPFPFDNFRYPLSRTFQGTLTVVF
jgi:TonB-linked SusC/RagA family outer membrane protein